MEIRFGYAYKSDARNHKRLLSGNSIHVIKLNYSLNESVGNIDFFELEDGNVIKIYDTVELISEKFRALLQQEIRKRVRVQDLYDLYYILDICSFEDNLEMKEHILKRLVKKSSSNSQGRGHGQENPRRHYGKKRSS